MSSRELFDDLLGPSLEVGISEAPVVEFYVRRLVALGRPEVYDYFHARDRDIVDCLPKARQKAEFVLTAWRSGPVEDWAHWAAAMPPSFKGMDALAPQVADLVDHMLRAAAKLEPAAARSVAEHLKPLRVALHALAQDDDGMERLAAAAREALEEREWWVSAEAVDAQAAMHELIRALENATLAAGHILKDARADDIRRAPLQGVEEVKGMLALAHDLPDEIYGELQEALPAPESAEQPGLYAETVVAKIMLQRRDPQMLGGFSVVRVHLKDIKALTAMGGDYWPQRRLAGVGCLDLRPTPAQVEWLSVYLTGNPGDDALEALARWTKQADRKQLAGALARMLRPHFDPTRWAAVLSRGDYVEAPVIRALRESMRKDRKTKVQERRRMAAIVGSLQIRTQSARDHVADLIVHLLKKERPKSDLSVALVLAEGLGPDHHRQAKLERAFTAYANRNSYKFKPEEYRSIVRLGITIPNKHLSKETEKKRQNILEAAFESGVKQFVKLMG